MRRPHPRRCGPRVFGNARLVGTTASAIVAGVRAALASERQGWAEAALPYGDGAAAPRIVAALDDWLAGSAPARAELLEQS